jgi:dTDP-glucose 4,6-dehydratase
MVNMILTTGSAGFIGGNFLHHLYKEDSNRQVVCVDSFTYASNYDYIKPLVDCGFVIFRMEDIGSKEGITNIFSEFNIEYIVNFAAESHVDNSISNYQPFIQTNVLGTINLLECSLQLPNLKKFIHISTDEVYGSLELDDKNSFTENTPYKPNSPYSASKASSDHFVRAFNVTYGLPTVITNCSNNYGPSQNKEKLIPKIINNILSDNEIPIYGTGDNIRDWLYVDDHCKAINLVLKNGRIGETYNVGGGTEVSNLALAKSILGVMGKPESLITFVDDRLGHDKRYSINYDKIKNELGYYPDYTLEDGLKTTIEWITNDNNTPT